MQVDLVGVADSQLIEFLAMQDCVVGFDFDPIPRRGELDDAGEFTATDLRTNAGLYQRDGDAVAFLPDLFFVAEREDIEHFFLAGGGLGTILGVDLVAGNHLEGERLRLRRFVEIRIAQHHHLRLAGIGEVGGGRAVAEEKPDGAGADRADLAAAFDIFLAVQRAVV